VSITRFGSGGPFEDAVGYSRVVRAGNWVLVAGSTATVGGVVVHVGDSYQQALTAFGIAVDALAQAGATVADVVRTRMYVTDIAFFAEVGRAHHDLFGAVRPVSCLVAVSALAYPEHLIEVEVDAYLAAGAG
jgi:enamine deaminase RidA (YjgF/YER057c/UK114 family)